MRSASKRRYNIRVAVAMVIYLVAVFGDTWLFNHHTIAVPLNYVLATLPALPVIAVLVFMGMYMEEEKDDFLRAIMVRSSLWATGVVLGVATFWGFIETYTVVPQVPMYFGFVIWCGVMGLSQPFLRRRYL